MNRNVTLRAVFLFALIGLAAPSQAATAPAPAAKKAPANALRFRVQQLHVDNNEGCAVADFDRDGHLDLFVCNYVRWQRERDVFCSLDGKQKSYCTPEAYRGETCWLFKNRGDGRFDDVTATCGIFDSSSKALGVALLELIPEALAEISPVAALGSLLAGILVFFMLLIVNFVVTIKYKIYENHSSLFITVSLMLLDALRCVTFIGTLFYEEKVLSSELIIRLGHDLPSFLFDCVTIALLFQFVFIRWSPLLLLRVIAKPRHADKLIADH